MNPKKYMIDGKLMTKRQVQRLYNAGTMRAYAYDCTDGKHIVEVLSFQLENVVVNFNGSVRILRYDNVGRRFKLNGKWRYLQDFVKY